MILLLLLRRCLNRILTTCKLRLCDMRIRLHSTLKQLVAFKTTIKRLNYGCFYPANTVESGYMANFNKYEPEPEAWWFECVEWIVFVACIWEGGQCIALSVFHSLIDGWVGKCNKRELSLFIMGDWVMWQSHSTEVFAKRRWYEMKRVRCLLGSGFEGRKTVEEWKRKLLFINETPCSVTIHFIFILSLYYGWNILWGMQWIRLNGSLQRCDLW